MALQALYPRVGFFCGGYNGSKIIAAIVYVAGH